jgi:hypothetical protein
VPTHTENDIIKNKERSDNIETAHAEKKGKKRQLGDEYPVAVFSLQDFSK